MRPEGMVIESGGSPNASFPILNYGRTAAEWHARERVRLEAAGKTPSFITRGQGPGRPWYYASWLNAKVF